MPDTATSRRHTEDTGTIYDGYSLAPAPAVPLGSETGSELSQWLHSAQQNPPTRTSSLTLFGNALRGVYEELWSWASGKRSLTFRRNYEPVTRGTVNEGWKASSVSILNVLHDPSGMPKHLVVGQFRTPIERLAIELPGGKMDEGETALTSAFRENAEETGLPDLSDGSTKKDGFRIRSSTLTGPHMTDSGIGGSGGMLAVLHWDCDKVIESQDDLPPHDLSEGEKARKLKTFVVPLSEMSAFTTECCELQIPLSVHVAMIPIDIGLASGKLSSSSAAAGSADEA